MRPIVSLVDFAYSLLLAAILLAIVARADGSSITVEWNSNPPNENVSSYKVLINGGIALTTSYTIAIVDAFPGDEISIVANNGADSDPSDPITVMAIEPRAVHVVLQSSGDLKAWKDVSTFYFNHNQKMFYRLMVIAQ